jgi:hypothetical protein
MWNTLAPIVATTGGGMRVKVGSIESSIRREISKVGCEAPMIRGSKISHLLCVLGVRLACVGGSHVEYVSRFGA